MRVITAKKGRLLQLLLPNGCDESGGGRKMRQLSDRAGGCATFILNYYSRFIHSLSDIVLHFLIAYIVQCHSLGSIGVKCGRFLNKALHYVFVYLYKQDIEKNIHK